MPPDAPRPSTPRPYAALEHRSFRWFIASLLSMTMAAQVQAVVVGWLVYQITRDPFALGLIGLAEVVPYVSVALLAGYVVDRSDRRKVSVIALATLVSASVALFAFATSFDEVVVTLFLAGPEQVTLPRQMFTGIRENINPTIAAVATLLIIFTTSLLLVLEWLRGRRR